MTNDEVEQLLPEYAAGLLTDAEREQVRAYLRSNPIAGAAKLAEAGELVALLPLALSDVEPSADVKARLLKRVATAGQFEQPSSNMTSRKSPFLGTIARVAAAVFFIGLLLVAGQSYINSKRVGDVLRSADLQLIEMKGTDNQPSAKGRIFWNKEKNRWMVQFFNVRQSEPGKTYQLWFITTDGKKISAGVFDANRGAGDEMIVEVPESASNSLAAAAVTDEPSGGLVQPSGKVQIIGEVKK